MEQEKKKSFHHGLSISDLAPILQAVSGIFLLIIIITVFYNKATTIDNVFQVIMVILSIFIIVVGLVFMIFRIIFVRRKHREHGIRTK
ncbi:MAG: hypothetical protein AABW73_01580 [Nanoarchaeota archaeon]